MPNRLADESSPYLLQHANNPVDWYPWGEEAFSRARAEDKPIFLSVGYSACHWCHVMEHESFENEAIAEIMNAHFVNVKVDREERPDVDEIYMNAVQLMTQQGGWPMSVFLTPDGAPFYGGTYFPPESRYGRPGFGQVLESIARHYREQRDKVTHATEQMIESLNRLGALKATGAPLDPDLVERAAVKLSQNVDDRHGGFGSQPKFPNTMNLEVLLRHATLAGDRDVLNCVTLTLDRMASGGIYDHLGGGFHRYSVDAEWLVPHFEKMLYDNALLLPLYARAHALTGNERYAQVVEETADYVLREMTSPDGGFYSTQDADTEGEEGKFFVWEPAEVRAVLGEKDAGLFCRYYDVTTGGNFEGKNILNVRQDLESVADSAGVTEDALRQSLEASRQKLLAVRGDRVAPARDEKIQVNWNGLMISGLCIAGQVLDRPAFREAAQRAATFILEALRGEDGLLKHSHKDGVARFNGYHDDYACLINGLVDLYESTFDVRWLDEAETLSERMIEQFWDDTEGGFFYTGKDHEALIVRSKNPYDNATPSGNAVAATALLRLSVLLDRPDLRARAEATVLLFQPYLREMPSGFGQMLQAADFLLRGPVEVVCVGDGVQALRKAIWSTPVAHRISAETSGSGSGPAMTRIHSQVGDRATAYVCRDQTCSAPIHDPESLRTALLAGSPV